jgi:hypothetical protein
MVEEPAAKEEVAEEPVAKEEVAEEPAEEMEVEEQIEVAKVVEPEPEVAFVPEEWTTTVKDAVVTMGGTEVIVPEEFEDYALTLRVLEENKIELYLEEAGMAPELLLTGISSLEPDDEGKIAFQVSEIKEENVQPVFDLLGLRVLDEDELRDDYFLFVESFDESGVAVLEAFDMDSSATMEFTRK